MWGFAVQAKDSAPPALAALALGLTAVAAASAPAAPLGPELGVSVAPAELTIGAELTVSGILTDAGHSIAGATLTLQSDAYPFRGFATVAHAATGPDGRFSFSRIRPDRNTRLRVLAEGATVTVSRELPVLVDPAVAINARRLGPGETRLSVRLRHTLQGGSRSLTAWWYTAPRGSNPFRLSAVTSTRELSPGVTYASAIVDPPAKRFAYRVCLNPPWERAMGQPSTHGPCPQHDFKAPSDAR
jgi:hypothetical protein